MMMGLGLLWVKRGNKKKEKEKEKKNEESGLGLKSYWVLGKRKEKK